MTVRGAPSRVQLPLDWPGSRRALERELQRVARQNEEPSFPAILLVSPDGTTWRVRVTDAGTLVSDPVART
jgi:hypothetical protein